MLDNYKRKKVVRFNHVNQQQIDFLGNMLKNKDQVNLSLDQK